MQYITRLVIGCLLIVFSFGAVLALRAYWPMISIDWSHYRWFFMGLLAYIIVMGVSNTLFHQNLKFFRTFVHELTHTIFSLLSLKGVRHFQASSHQGGEIHVVGGSNMLISLSPYCIPILTLFLILLSPLFQTQFTPYLEGAIGLTYFFHLHTNWLQLHPRQTDITRYGYFSSYSFIAFFQILFFGIILLFFREHLNAFWLIPKTSIEKLMLLFSFIQG